MGRPRTPTALKLIQGTYRPDRNPGEPEYAPGLPEPPEWIDPVAKEFWISMAERLAPGVATVIDWPGWLCCCETWAQLVKLRRDPLAGARNIDATERRFAFWLGKFGLTPADRSKVIASGGSKTEDPWDEV